MKLSEISKDEFVQGLKDPIKRDANKILDYFRDYAERFDNWKIRLARLTDEFYKITLETSYPAGTHGLPFEEIQQLQRELLNVLKAYTKKESIRVEIFYTGTYNDEQRNTYDIEWALDFGI